MIKTLTFFRINFLATLVALHSKLLSRSVGRSVLVSNQRSFEACELVYILCFDLLESSLFLVFDWRIVKQAKLEQSMLPAWEKEAHLYLFYLLLLCSLHSAKYAVYKISTLFFFYLISAQQFTIFKIQIAVNNVQTSIVLLSFALQSTMSKILLFLLSAYNM